jgi:hypothetical protein
MEVLFRGCVLQIDPNEEAPLAIQAEGSLPVPVSPQLLEVQAPECVEVVRSCRRVDDLEDLEERVDDRDGIPPGSSPGRVERLQALRGKAEFQ